MEKISALNTFLGLLVLGTLIISGIANYKKQKKEKNPSPGMNTFIFVFILLIISNIFRNIGGTIGQFIGLILIIVLSLYRLNPSDKKSKLK
jgi:hypothetical protein